VEARAADPVLVTWPPAVRDEVEDSDAVAVLDTTAVADSDVADDKNAEVDDDAAPVALRDVALDSAAVASAMTVAVADSDDVLASTVAPSFVTTPAELRDDVAVSVAVASAVTVAVADRLEVAVRFATPSFVTIAGTPGVPPDPVSAKARTPASAAKPLVIVDVRAPGVPRVSWKTKSMERSLVAGTESTEVTRLIPVGVLADTSVATP
jgi:hypothetical protein